jgi:hypothetical protein
LLAGGFGVGCIGKKAVSQLTSICHFERVKFAVRKDCGKWELEQWKQMKDESER